MKRLIALLIIAGLAGVAYQQGALDPVLANVSTALKDAEKSKAKKAAKPELVVPAVSTVRVEQKHFVETVMVTGSLVAREEILVSPQLSNLRVQELRAEEGDRVEKDDILAVLVVEQLDAQLAQNDAALARAVAAIAQAKSSIADADARVIETKANLKRARPLLKKRFLSQSTFDQRAAAATSAAAQLDVAKNSLRSAEAEKRQVEAQRRELNWSRSNADVRAPAAGIISKRSVRIGEIAQVAFPGVEPMFKIIRHGEIDLEAEVPERDLTKIKLGQRAKIEVSGVGMVEGKVRLLSPEVDPTTRLGKIKIALDDNVGLRIGAFGKGTVATATSVGLSVPRSSILYSERTPRVLVVIDDKVANRPIKTGLASGNDVEVIEGLDVGQIIVAKAGTFLRDGDSIRPIIPAQKISEANE